MSKLVLIGRLITSKAHIVAKGYIQIFGLYYRDTFSLIAKMTSVRRLLSIIAMNPWPLYHLDIENTFLHCDLKEDVCIEQPTNFVA